MTKTILYFTFIFTILFTACKKNYKDGSCEPNSNALTFTHNNQQREYLAYIPDSYDGSSSVPLLFNFHGFGGSANEHMNNSDMRVLAESETFILVYPQGTCTDGFSHWNPSLAGGDNKSSAEDLDFIEALINKLSTDYNIDNKRVYACGYSNGGMLAYGLANYKSDLIAAVGSISGTALDFNAPTSHPMPIIHLHGTSDDVIPYNGSNDYNSAQSILDYWTNFNNTITNPTVNSESNGGITIEHYVYDQGDNDVSVEHYKYIGGGHVWFTETYQGQNTAELLWNFFSKYDIDGLR